MSRKVRFVCLTLAIGFLIGCLEVRSAVDGDDEIENILAPETAETRTKYCCSVLDMSKSEAKMYYQGLQMSTQLIGIDKSKSPLHQLFEYCKNEATRSGTSLSIDRLEECHDSEYHTASVGADSIGNSEQLEEDSIYLSEQREQL